MGKKEKRQPWKEGDIVVLKLHNKRRCRLCKARIPLENRLFIEHKVGEHQCLECSGLGDLTFLPSGDVAMTVRASKHSRKRAVVCVKQKKRGFLRIGLLVEPRAIELARRQCEADAEVRAENRALAAVRREREDAEYRRRFMDEILEHYPSIPRDSAQSIAEHACKKYSGRVGRTAMAKDFERRAIRLAVRAFIRHKHTPYEELLKSGVRRHEARERIRGAVWRLEENWRKKQPRQEINGLPPGVKRRSPKQ